jgi:hypothetical protein
MNNYKVIGESREVGAIGVFEPFTINIVAGCSKYAYDDVHNRLYSNNREHVHIKEIRLITDDNQQGSIVEPMAYLYK